MNQPSTEPLEDTRETEQPGNGETASELLAPRSFPSYLPTFVDPEPAFPCTSILGIPLHIISMEDAILTIMDRLYADSPSHVCFVNAHCANLAYSDSEYSRVLHTATFSFPDGVGLRLAGKLLGRQIPYNVNGTDLFPLLCAALEETEAGVFLFGGRPGIAEGVRDWIGTHYPDVHVSGWRHGYFSPEEEPILLRQIADSGARLLLVALGAPLQDLWIHRHLPMLGVQVAMGVGGLFDFYSGHTPRAPLWLRRRSGEWLYRLYQEPGRMWRRYVIGNPLFLARVMREWFQRSCQSSDANRWSTNVLSKQFPS